MPQEPAATPPWQPAAGQIPDPVLISQDMGTIQQIMWNYVGLVRTGKRLERSQRELRHLWHEIEEFYRTSQVNDQLIGLRNAVQVARMVTFAAVRNPNSRGTHYRADAVPELMLEESVMQ